MAKTPTLADLQAERATLDQKIAAAELAPMGRARDALNGEHASALMADLEEASKGLADGPAKQATANVRQIITSARQMIDRALRNAEIRANGGAEPSPNPAPDAEA